MNNSYELDELMLDVWSQKYRQGNESLDGFFYRIAKEFARLDSFNNKKEPKNLLSSYGQERLKIEDYVKHYEELFHNFKYIIPGGSVLSGIGTDKLVSLSNCFVVSTGDSIEEIFNTATEMSQIYKRRGGVGTDLSSLRPRNAAVNNAAKTTSGVVPFMELFSQVTNTIGQEGRRGALMLSIDINHPDSPEFITSKQNLTKITGANISVRLNNEFLRAVENNEDYILRWPCNKDLSIFTKGYLDINYNELVYIKDHTDNNSIIYIKRIKAKELWDSIIQCAWNTAEPGILFWDSILDNDPAGVYPDFRAVSTNPCGEIPLSPYDSCRLIAVNLYSLVKNPFTSEAHINWAKAAKIFYEAQIIGDILVDLELEAVQKLINNTQGREQELWKNIYDIGCKGRRTGVGLLGLGDMFAALGVDYGDENILRDLLESKQSAELNASIDLAVMNGPFPAYNKDLEYKITDPRGDPRGAIGGTNKFFNHLLDYFPGTVDRMYSYGRRNISWSTVAPTGTISILAGTSSGCEPVFSLYYTRRKKCNSGETPDFVDQSGVGFKNYNVIHPKLKVWWNEYKKSISNPIEKDLSEWTKQDLDSIIKFSPWASNTAEDLTPEVRVKTQAILQQFTTHSISSTVNVSEDTTPETIKEIYENAWKYNLKGITVYRDNCRSGILVKSEEKPKVFEGIVPRPTELNCKVEQFKNEKKDWLAIIGLYNGKPYEIFTGPKDIDVFPIPSSVTEGMIIKVKQEDGISRYDFRYVDSYGYTNTLGGLSRVFDKEYWNYGRLVSGYLRSHMPIDQIVKIIDGLTFTNKGMNNWKSGVIRALKPFIADGTKVHGETCENCGGSNIVYENGCKTCRDCLNSKCG